MLPVQFVIDLLSGVQTELIVFAIAVCFHSLLFGKHRIRAGRKGAKGAAFVSAPVKSTAALPNQAQVAFTSAVAAAAPQGSEQAGIEAAIAEHLPAGAEVAALEALVAGHCQARLGGAELPRAVRAVLASQGLKPTTRLSELLLRACLRSRSAVDVLEIFRSIAAPSAEALSAAAQFADRTGDVELASLVLTKLPSTTVPEVAVPLLRVANSKDLGPTALDIYTKHFSEVDLSSDLPLQHSVAAAAVAQGRDEVLEQIVSATASGTSSPAALVRSFAAAGGFASARRVFEVCKTKTPGLYNALLSAATDCKDLPAAQRVTEEAKEAGMADVVTYNTMIKAYVQAGDLRSGRAVLRELRSAGLEPNCVTFNELIDASAKKNLRDMWELVSEMQSSGLKPNQVTCSIVLKSIQSCSRAEDVERALAVVDEANDAMDEVLLSSLCEACIRCNRSDLLSRVLRQQRSNKAITVKGAHTFGSLIRAYGFLGDMSGVWNTWKELKSRRVAPSCITLGCMVEAVATNGDPDAAHKLIRETLEDLQTRPLVNAVIFCSVLKSYCHKRCFDKVWAVHEEMRELNLQYSIVTYNALIDACARSADMRRVHSLLEDMQKDNIEPNVITYSTVLKGYCQEGRMDRAFTVLEDMKKNKSFSPDEVTYNTLLDGCARFGMFERGMEVLADMEESGVKPSNFTVSVLVKLANRSRRFEKAFELSEEVSKKYNFALNMHVYNNLMQACTSANQHERALAVFEKMLDQRIKPDSRSYKILLQSSVQLGDKEQTVSLLHAAVGKRCALPRFNRFTASAMQPKGGLASDVVMAALDGLAERCRDEALALEMYRELRSVPGLSLNSKSPMRWASGGLRGRA
eukprot:SRR837773.12515.p1 GENE.SRR837773.12515~~SRR837773.12515.p1  ORF type:complete len:861 (+),score=288.72 SRR837773.12515:2-2584(+)